MSEQELFEHKDGRRCFRDLAVVDETVVAGGRAFRLAGLRDAADLLDHPDYAKRFVEEDKAPYGMELWPAAPMLAEYILNGDDGGERAALDLGCGLGLVAMAAAIKGWDVFASDYDPDALRFCQYNASINGVTIPHYQLLDWNRPPMDRTFDRIFGSDVLYQLVDHEPILRCVKQLLAGGGIALLADPYRGVADRFAALAGSHGFSVETMETTAPFRGNAARRGRIFRLRHGPDTRPVP
jgi:predicted nicotinamide N-methyase